MSKNNLELMKVSSLSAKEIEKVDSFILDQNTNGEFINTISFLDYHHEKWFKDDSIIIRDSGSKNIKGVMVACVLPDAKDKIISHAGTTFSGPIINYTDSFEMTSKCIEMMFDYYEEKYKTIELRIPPVFFGAQPFGIIDFMLLNRGFQYRMKGLSNIIDLSHVNNEEDVFSMFNGKRRNQVKKVCRSEKFIFQENDEISADVWEQMNNNLNRKFGVSATHSIEDIRDLKSRFPNNIKAYYVNTNNGEYGAFCLAFKFKNVFHTQYLDTNYEYTGQYPNLYLIKELILLSINEGYNYFSFGASTENNGEYMNEGLYSYKAGYGGGSILLPMYVKQI